MKLLPKNFLKGFDPDKHVVVAKYGCNRCHSRGVVGRNLTTGEDQLCTCLRLRPLPASKGTEIIHPNHMTDEQKLQVLAYQQVPHEEPAPVTSAQAAEIPSNE